jgi:hypothetical protein
MWTPIDAIFRGGGWSQTPVRPSIRSPRSRTPRRADERLLEVAAVLPDVAAVPVQVEDRVADELPGAVEGGFPATVGLHHLDLRAAGTCSSPSSARRTERDHRRVLQEDDRVRA